MKCYACRYERDHVWNSEIDKMEEIGREEFIPLNISGSYENTNGYLPRTERIELIMCPKCGTVRVDVNIEYK